MSASLVAYVVEFTIRVDRPHMRDASFAPVRPGHAIHSVERHASYSDALRSFEALRAGRYDFRSEFISRVECYQSRAGRSPRTIRRAVKRERPVIGPGGMALAPLEALHFAAWRAGRILRTVSGQPAGLR